jgi:hypothetical protein
MQKEQDLTVRARPVIARWWPARALAGRSLHTKTSAAHGGTKVLLFVTTVCAQIMLGCGDERPPWSGFPIFPDAGGFELSPELASGLLAAQAAFARQIAEQGAPDAGHVSSGTTGPIVAGRATAGSEAPKPPPPNENPRGEAESDEPSMAADPAPPAMPDDTRRSTMRRRGSPVDAGIAADGDTPAQSPAADSGVPLPPDTTPAADSGVPLTPDAGPTPPPPPTPTPDAGTPPPTAGSAAPTTTEDAGTPTSDADGGN